MWINSNPHVLSLNFSELKRSFGSNHLAREQNMSPVDRADKDYVHPAGKSGPTGLEDHKYDLSSQSQASFICGPKQSRLIGHLAFHH